MRIVYSPLDALALARASRPSGRSCSSPSASRPPRRPTRWRSRARPRWASTTSRCWSRTCWCRRRWTAILGAPDNRVQGFLAAGHVCTVMGLDEYEPLAARYRRADRRHRLRAARSAAGHPHARAPARSGARARWRTSTRARCARTATRAARAVDRRGVRASSTAAGAASATLPAAAWRCARRYAALDAARRFGLDAAAAANRPTAAAGEVLRGLLKPTDCPAFGTRCTPEHPLGATMVSSEGACAAYFRYRRDARIVTTRRAREAAQRRPRAVPIPLARTMPCCWAHGSGGRMTARSVATALPAAVRNRGAGRSPATARWSPPAASAWRSRPTRSWSARCSSRAATSASWPCTARSTTWPWRAPRPRRCRAAFMLEEGLPLAELRGLVRSMRAAAARGGRRARRRRHQGRRSRQGRRRLHHHLRHRRACRPASTCARRGRGRATWCW